MEAIQAIRSANLVLTVIFTLLCAYQLLYLLLPLVKREKPRENTTLHRYGVLISARNEEAVLGHLLDSIRAQDYPGELVDIYVVADNCTDRTADIAREGGAVVFERFDTVNVGKGFALDFLLKKIWETGAVHHGYFVFDADNLLSENYITEMNKAISPDCAAVTSYRSSKNYDANWISAGYGLWFLREAEFLNHARALVGNSCAVSGCGFLIHGETLRRQGGWPFHLLTEDIEFTMETVTGGGKIGYCGSAVFYDEQPVRFSQSVKQRLRWAKGYLQVFRKYGGALCRGCFGENAPSCYDMIMSNVPAVVLSVASFTLNLLGLLHCLATGEGLLIMAQLLHRSFAGTYLSLYFLGLLTTLTQWRRIPALPSEKLRYTLSFPFFMMTYLPISLAALFRKVEWSPIEHTAAVTIKDIVG